MLKQLSLPKKLIAFFLLATIVLSWTIESIQDPEIDGGDMGLIITMVTKDMKPQLFQSDPIFKDDSLYRFYTPSYRWLLAQLWQLTGSIETGLLWLTPLVLAIYVAAMFWLAYLVTGNIWIAVALTLISAKYRPVIAGEIWGVAAVDRMIPRTIFTAFAPLLFGVMLIWLRKPRLGLTALLGLGIGLSANIHPTSGLGLIFITVGLFVLIWGVTWAGLLRLVYLAGFVIVGVAPFAFNFLTNTGRSLTDQISFETFSQVIRTRNPVPFEPQEVEWPLLDFTFYAAEMEWLVWIQMGLAGLALLLYFWGRWSQPGLLHWLWLVGGLAALWYAYFVTVFNVTFLFGLVSGYIIYRFWRNDIDQLDGWLLASLGLITGLSMTGTYLLTWLWETFEIWSLTAFVVEQARIARFVYLPLYLLSGRAALAMANELKNLWTTPQNPEKEGVTALVALGLGLGVQIPFDDPALVVVPFVVLVACLLVGTRLILSRFYPLVRLSMPWLVGVFIIFVIFGPLGWIMADYTNFPTANLWQDQGVIPGSSVGSNEQGLYQWVKTHTSADSLFYQCDLRKKEVLSFRYQTERSSTFSEKALNLGMYDRASLVKMYEQHQYLTKACQDPFEAIAVGREIQADYILVPTEDYSDLFDPFICFQNKEFTVFGLDDSGCGSSRQARSRQ